MHICLHTQKSSQICESDDDSHQKSNSYCMWLCLVHLKHHSSIRQTIRLCFNSKFYINLMSMTVKHKKIYFAQYYWKHIHNPNIITCIITLTPGSHQDVVSKAQWYKPPAIFVHQLVSEQLLGCLRQMNK